ncbi:ATP-binding cassette domain-containing protein [Sinomonas sp. G460-2]|uniref:ATP-binding cassette domain-containing protein n=1 Tax=Sinomonas sp. G460-2 TaxID=3393464 RepID=UPI0039EF7E94
MSAYSAPELNAQGGGASLIVPIVNQFDRQLLEFNEVARAGMTLAMDVSGVCKRYGKKAALTDFRLQLEPGRIHGLLGPNGSGKTTGLHIVTGLVVPDAGEVIIAGSPDAMVAPGTPTGLLAQHGDGSTLEDVFLSLTGLREAGLQRAARIASVLSKSSD